MPIDASVTLEGLGNLGQGKMPVIPSFHSRNVGLYWRCYEYREAHGRTTSLSEVMTRIRQEHQREVLRAACEEAAQGTPVEQVLERYLGEATPQAA